MVPLRGLFSVWGREVLLSGKSVRSLPHRWDLGGETVAFWCMVHCSHGGLFGLLWVMKCHYLAGGSYGTSSAPVPGATKSDGRWFWLRLLKFAPLRCTAPSDMLLCMLVAVLLLLFSAPLCRTFVVCIFSFLCVLYEIFTFPFNVASDLCTISLHCPVLVGVLVDVIFVIVVLVTWSFFRWLYILFFFELFTRSLHSFSFLWSGQQQTRDAFRCGSWISALWQVLYVSFYPVEKKIYNFTTK